MASANKVLQTLEQAIRTIDLLYQLPELAEWELETRVKANRDHACREFDRWLEQKKKEKMVPA